nr:hypothetical protein [Tanacetum cinerariifolium]
MPTGGVVIRETPLMSLLKKEKVTIEKHKGIDLLSEVALTEEAQYKEVHKKSLRDFHKTHPSGSGTVTKISPSAAKIKPSVTNEGTGAKPGVPDVTEEESTKNEAESWGKDEDESDNDHDSRSEGSNQERDSGDDNTQCDSEKGSDFEHETDENETDDTKINDKTKGDEDEGLDYNTNQFDDDVNVRLNEPVTTDERFIQKEGTDAENTNKDEFVKTVSNDTDDEDDTKIKDKTKGDEDEGLDYNTNQFDDDVNVRLNEPVTTDERKCVQSEEPKFEVVDAHMPQDQEENLGNDNEEPKRKSEEPKFEVVDAHMPQDQEENMGNDNEEPKRKTFYGYARGLESTHDVYSTKRILAVTRVEVMRKHGYGYLREIKVRRADNNLYTFKEGDFPRLRINDIEGMLILIIQNRLTNISSDDVFDFAIALRMFSRIMVIKKESNIFNWESKITKRRSTSPSLILQDLTSGKRTYTLHIKTLKDSFMLTPKGETC